MKIRPVGSELFQTGGRTLRRQYSHFLILRTLLKNKFADYGARQYMQRLMRRQMRRIFTLTHILVFW